MTFEDLFTKPRRAARSFAELLPWFGLVAPGLVLCKDGSLLAGFEFSGDDVEGKEDFAADQRIELLQNALRTLTDRCTLWTFQERRFTSGYLDNEFSNPVARLIDRQWEKACGQRRNARLRQTMYLGYNFPNRSEAFFEAVGSALRESDGRVLPAFTQLVRQRLSERGALSRVRGQLGDMAHEFEKIISDFSGVVDRAIGFHRLIEGELLGELYGRANLASAGGPVDPPDLDQLAYLNTLLATDDVDRQHDLFRFRGPSKTVWVGALSTTGTPKSAHSSQVDNLMALDCEYVLCQCFRVLDRVPAEKDIQDAEMFYRSEVKSVVTRVAERLFDVVSDKVNTGNLTLADDAQEALVELTTGDVAYGYYNMTVLALGDTQRQAEAAVDLLSSTLRAGGYTVLRERQGLLSAILTTFAGSANATLRWKLTSTANIADLAPIRTISTGESTHPLFSRILKREVPPLCRFVTPYGVTYDFNPHEGDLGHTAVVGGSGAGKTTLLTLLIAQFQKYNPSRTFIFDKDYSLMAATVLLGGKHIDMGRKGKRRNMNPVRVMMEGGDDSRLRQWLEVLIGAGGNTVSAQESTNLNAAIQQLRKSHSVRWKLSGLYALVAGQNQDLALKLAPYVDRTEEEGDYNAGSHAAYFDNQEDDFALTNMVGMECGGLLDDPKVASPFMDYAFYCIERALDGNTPSMIYVEEAWYMLSNPAFVSKMEDWLRTFRKKRAFVMFATQSLDELARLPNLGSFVTNIPSQILLPSMKSSVHEQADQYKAIWGTTDAQIELLAQAIPKRDYLLVRPNTTRLVNTDMPAVLIAINEATTQEHKRSALLDYAREGGPDWELRYLKEVLNVKA
nr:type IV secretion system protein VirB4 [Ramlibacter albus]